LKQFSFDIEQWNRLFPFFILLNEQMELISYGQSLEKKIPGLIGHSFTELFTIEQPTIVNASFSEIQSLKNELFFLKSLPSKKGVSINLRGQFELMDADKFLLFVGSPWFDDLKEISERNQFKHFSLITEGTVNGGVITDAHGKILWVNKAFEKITGYQLDEIKGQSPGSFLQGKDTNQETVDYLSAQIKAGKHFDCEIINYNKLKKPYWIKISGQPIFDDQGKLIEFFALEEDITEKKQIEEQMRLNEKRYRDLFNYSQALICTHDINGNMISVNPAICDLLGYSSEEMIGKSLIDFLPAKEGEKFKSQYLDVVAKEGKSKGVFRVLHKNGKKLYLLFQNYKFEEYGVEPYIIGFSQDITDRIQAENDLLLAKQITENVSKAKEIFLANMSHEIRTPMNGILGVANLLAKTKLDDQQKNYLKLIKESANNLLLIVNDVLEIEKIASGKIEFEQIPFRFEEKINTAIQSFQYKVEEKGLQLICHNHLQKDLVVLGDPYRLSQILNNLLNNAIKFTNEGKIVVELNTVSIADNNILIEISITDTGIGIDNNKLDTIFEPFMQASTDTTRKFGGTGLGLSICKNLVEMKGGAITVKSQLNKGTVFNIRLPYKISSVDLLVENEKAPVDYSVIGKKRILIAEDVALNQFIASQILESWGMVVAVADNGKIAVDMVQQSAYDLILMDIQMPEMDGIEATEIIRKMADPVLSKIPIIALTANALKGDNHRYFQVGMNDYITKPYTEEKLFSVISKFLTASAPSNSSNENSSHKVNEDSVKEIAFPNPHQIAEPLLYDLTMVKQIGKGNAIFLQKMVALFLTQMPIDIDHLREAAGKLDWDAVSKLAHRMKPTIDGMGMISLKESIRELESRSSNHVLLSDQEMKTLLTSITSIMEKTLLQLKNEFPE
jgi:PAS domain S-box-containing protein